MDPRQLSCHVCFDAAEKYWTAGQMTRLQTRMEKCPNYGALNRLRNLGIPDVLSVVSRRRLDGGQGHLFPAELPRLSLLLPFPTNACGCYDHYTRTY
jgi:hypothetical protein